ncbi:E3 ubiquitin-protein ligase RNF19B-like [Zootermopsis nevadensis]|nr:E3 ubiquitin-protein ligase RNF19B-like [Zootermopsis nevadensis]XP_021939738.1 E3 ubiquitin-protein ligase RNF19B-like [Zootermopsis nevadensis]XP_021939739.1 E3 ubiquitin-protein ligase RNF19B-like [Zootermopsis nevadensis]XP_021939740.1 E3 ubiquitin-protein ligase RNF19B-like [Zootermopsis nevadensis]
MRKSHETDSHSTCSTANQRKRGLARFSLRRLLYSSPLVARRITRGSSSTSKNSRNAGDGRASEPSRDMERGGAVRLSSVVAGGAPLNDDLQQASSKPYGFGMSAGKSCELGIAECPLCLAELPVEYFPRLSSCSHRSCYDCFQQYLRIEISESRVSIACPECSEPMHPNDIRMILNDKLQYEKYEDFMVRRVLAVDPDTRWCPAPDCSFAVIAAGCASCPKIKCERPGCDAYFCYHCKAEWHPNQTCDAARAQRSPNVRSSSVSFSQDSQHRDDIKPCPRCQVLIVKMDDGSCNHMTCAVCGAEFCWLCMKEISDLHYLSPSGCTFWGKKPWSRKKKILWQLGTLVGAPVGIGLVAGIAVPAMIIGIPVWVGRKLYARYEHANKHKRNLAIAGGVTASVLVSPVLAGLAVGIGVPILLFYVYGVVPVSLCRSGGCGVSTSGAGVRFDFDDENDLLGVLGARNTDAVSMDAVSHRGGNPSIGEVSLSLGSGSQLERLGRENDRESASNVALAGASIAGSIASSFLPGGQRLEVQADVASSQRFSMSSETASAATSLSEKSVSASIADDGAASTRALAGSVLNFKMDSSSLSGFRGTSVDACTPVEIHTDSASQRSDEVAGPASLSSLEELTSGMMRRTRRKPPLDRQGSESSSWAAGGEDGGSERVRFDDHVSFIAPHSYEASHSSQCDKESSIGGRGRWWSTETRCHRELPGEEHVGGLADMKRITAVRQELRNAEETVGSKAVDECIVLDGDDADAADYYDGNYDDFTVTSTNTAAATAAIPATTTSTVTVTACYHTASKSDISAETVNKDKLHGTSAAISGCNKSTSAATLRNVFFHAPPAESKRLPKLRKAQESVGSAVDGEQHISSRQTLALPVIPEPSIDQPHSSPPRDMPVKIEVPIESD